jgi:hypothetical protein
MKREELMRQSVGNTRPIARVHHLQHRPNNLGNTVGPLTLTLSRRERERRWLFLQGLLDQHISFCHMPVDEEGER